MIEGIVQGVGFRAWLERTAAGRGLAGWVRNRRDGAVEAVISGPREAVDAVALLCRRGPSHAAVSSVRVIDEPECDARNFEFRSTV